MSDNTKLNKPPTEYDGRDAIHIAIFPAIAGEDLMPNDDIGFLDKNQNMFGKCGKRIGKVNPFLPGKVKRGQRFWGVCYPNTISSLKHVWEHKDFPPAFQENGPQNKSQAYLEIEKIADSLGVDTDELIDRAHIYLKSGSYWCGGESFEGLWLPEEFWDYYEELKSTKVDEDDRHSFFRCAC